MIEIEKKSQCTGCTACQSICPKQCIKMEYDNEGFKYPSVDKTVCINCGLCDKVCPCKQKLQNKNYKIKAHAVQHIDEKVRIESSSGGAFSALAEYIIFNNGVVYGASYDDEYRVVHIRINKRDDIAKLRGSKYVQSELEGIFESVYHDLKEGKPVLFSGTPCQVEGLHHYIDLKKHSGQLFTVDFVCHGIPSPKLWEKYLAYLRKKHGKITYLSFRNKHYGYAGSTMAIGFNGKINYTGKDIHFYKKLFFDDINSRPSCFNCHFKSISRRSDLTLFDCWHMNEIDKQFDDDKGTTWILIQSERGQHIFNKIKGHLHLVETPVDIAIKLDGMLAERCTVESPLRKQFFNDWQSMDIELLIQKYYPRTIKQSLTVFIKPLIAKLGMIKVLKRIVDNKISV